MRGIIAIESAIIIGEMRENKMRKQGLAFIDGAIVISKCSCSVCSVCCLIAPDSNDIFSNNPVNFEYQH